MKISDSELLRIAAVVDKSDISVNRLIQLVEKSNKLVDVTAFDFELVVDYTKTIKEAIAEGKYDVKNYDINEHNFPINPELIGKKVVVKCKLFNFDRELNSGQVKLRISEAKYQPANLMELLALGAARPELQRIITITAFGSCWEDRDGYFNIPALHANNNKRHLNTYFTAHMFSPRLFTLCVPKLS